MAADASGRWWAGGAGVRVPTAVHEALLGEQPRCPLPGGHWCKLGGGWGECSSTVHCCGSQHTRYWCVIVIITQAGVQILSVPRRYLITVEMGQELEIGKQVRVCMCVLSVCVRLQPWLTMQLRCVQMIAADVDVTAKKHCYLCVYALVDRLNMDSYFQPYYSTTERAIERVREVAWDTVALSLFAYTMGSCFVACYCVFALSARCFGCSLLIDALQTFCRRSTPTCQSSGTSHS